MKTQRIVEILKSGAVDTDVVVKGWVRTKRGNKNVAFIALNDGSCVGNIQVVVDLAKIAPAGFATQDTIADVGRNPANRR